MPSLQELREEAQKLDNEVLQIRSEHDKYKAEGKTGDDAWGGAEKRKRFKDVMARREVLRKELEDEQDAASLLSESEEINRRSTGNGGSGRPAGDMNHEPDRRGDSRHGDRREDRGIERFQRNQELAFRAWATQGLQQSEGAEERSAACRELRFDPTCNTISFDLPPTHEHRYSQRLIRSAHPELLQQRLADGALRREYRALSAHNGPTGAYLIPGTFVRSLEINMLAFNSIEQAADVMLTDTGEEMGWPSADDTSNEGERLGEARTTSATQDPTFKLTKWRAYEYSSMEVKVPRPLLEDNAVGLDNVLPEMLAERVARKFNRECTTGTANSQPNGVVTASALGRTAASATAITGDEFIYLFHSVDPAYRTNAAFMMHDSIAAQLALLKDTTNQPIWRSGLVDGNPDRLLGKPVYVNQYMDSALAASNKVALFGDFSRYKIRRVRRVFLTRIVEKYANQNQVAYLLIVRQDGNLLNTGTNPIKRLQMAAA